MRYIAKKVKDEFKVTGLKDMETADGKISEATREN